MRKAKPKPARVPGARPGCGWALAAAWLIGAGAAFAAGGPADERAFILPFRTAVGTHSVGIALDRQEMVFKKEPAWNGHEVIRGALPFGSRPGDTIGFAWDKTAGRLLLDINRDLDLTDAATAVYDTAPQRYSQRFKDIHLRIPRDGVEADYLFDLQLRFFGRSPYGTMTIRSGWQGEIELGGARRVMAVMDNLKGGIGKADLFLIGPPRIEPGAPARVTSVDEVPGTARLSFGADAYRLHGAWIPDGTGAALRLVFTPEDQPAAALRLGGQFVDRLVFKGETTAIVDAPGDNPVIPAGRYPFVEVRLRTAPTSSCMTATLKSFTADATTTTMLAAGGPLTNTVSVTARGSGLYLVYELRGAGGETYTPTLLSSRDAPAFSIFRDGREIAHGVFSYG